MRSLLRSSGGGASLCEPFAAEARGGAATGGRPLIACAVVPEVKGWGHTHSWWPDEIVGATHDVGTKALAEFVDCHLQSTLPSKDAEKIELNPIIDADMVVGDHANQAEGTGVVKLVEELDAD